MGKGKIHALGLILAYRNDFKFYLNISSSCRLQNNFQKLKELFSLVFGIYYTINYYHRPLSGKRDLLQRLKLLFIILLNFAFSWYETVVWNNFQVIP